MFENKKIKDSFKAAKKDVNNLRTSVNDWIVFLNGNQNDIKVKLRELDRRLRKLESELEIKVYK